MNFLALVQRCKVEAGILGPVPSSVVGGSGDAAKIAGWVGDAWNALQLQPQRNWRWLRAAAQGAVNTAGGLSYTIDALLGVGAGTTRFSRWRDDQLGADDELYRPYCWDAGGTSWQLRQVPYDTFVSRFLIGVHANAAPQYWSVAPDGSLLVGPTPDAAYTVRAEYVKAPQVLMLDDDVPEMPAHFHMAIVWLALWSYAGYDAAPEVAARAMAQYNEIEAGLVLEQADRLRFASVPLA